MNAAGYATSRSRIYEEASDVYTLQYAVRGARDRRTITEQAYIEETIIS